MAVANNQFHIPSSSHPLGLVSDAFKGRPGSKYLQSLPFRVDNGPPAKVAKQTTKQEENFLCLVELVEQTQARDSREFVNWGLSQTDNELRTEICVKFFSEQNFDRLVSKAITMINLTNKQKTWHEALATCSPPASCNMSRATSRAFLDQFFATNGLDPQETAREIKRILDKKSGKVNTILFKGPSNAGKPGLQTL